jgi:hypothetical protein
MNPLFFIIPFFILVIILLIYKKTNQKRNNYVISNSPPPITIPPLGINLGYSLYSPEMSKTSPKRIYYSNHPELMNSNKIFQNSDFSTPSPNGYYSNGVNWRLWVSPNFMDFGNH